MAEPKWTQGPWFVDEEGDTIYDSRGFEIAQLHYTAVRRQWWKLGIEHWSQAPGEAYIERSPEEVLANSRLMGAAPDLYEACESALTLLENVKAWINLLDDEKAVIAKLEAALRKARGETNE